MSHKMDGYNRRPQLLSDVILKNQVKGALSSYSGLDAPEIITEADYRAARALYTAMDASVPPEDLHSSAARYVLALGVRIAKWESKNIHTVDLGVIWFLNAQIISHFNAKTARFSRN